MFVYKVDYARLFSLHTSDSVSLGDRSLHSFKVLVLSRELFSLSFVIY